MRAGEAAERVVAVLLRAGARVSVAIGGGDNEGECDAADGPSGRSSSSSRAASMAAMMGGGTVLEFARSSTLSATSRALVEQAAANPVPAWLPSLPSTAAARSAVRAQSLSSTPLASALMQPPPASLRVYGRRNTTAASSTASAVASDADSLVARASSAGAGVAAARNGKLARRADDSAPPLDAFAAAADTIASSPSPCSFFSSSSYSTPYASSSPRSSPLSALSAAGAPDAADDDAESAIEAAAVSAAFAPVFRPALVTHTYQRRAK
jgi:hypothetical protein